MNYPQVSIVILNWNGYHDTMNCLESLCHVTYTHHHIIVVDNGSQNDSVQRISEWADQKKIGLRLIRGVDQALATSQRSITMIALEENLGFSGGNNVGIRLAIKSGANYILLLNNDTIVTEDFLSCMVKTAMATQDIGIVGGKIKYFDHKDKVWFSGGYVDLVSGMCRHLGDDYTGQRKADFITGCLMLIPSGVLQNVGLLDEGYFLVSEDADFSHRVKTAGYKLIVDCQAVIYHKVNAAMGGLYSKRSQYYFHRNRMLFFSKKLKGVKKYVFYFFQFMVAIPIWMCVQLLRGRMTTLQGAFLGYLDFMRGRFGKCRYFN